MNCLEFTQAQDTIDDHWLRDSTDPGVYNKALLHLTLVNHMTIEVRSSTACQVQESWKPIRYVHQVCTHCAHSVQR